MKAPPPRPPARAPSTFFGRDTHQQQHAPIETSGPSASKSASHRRRCLECKGVPAAAGAGFAIASSSAFGMFCERRLGGGGHVATLMSAATLSNLSQLARFRDLGIRIPAHHDLYDLCWSIVLPSSLVFALLSSALFADVDSNRNSAESKTMKNTVASMALPFVIGSLGNNRKRLCVCTSFSALTRIIENLQNFFATAKVMKVDSDAIGSAAGSMAAADLVVMAFYFMLLSAASRSPWLHHLFPPSRKENESGDIDMEASAQRYSTDTNISASEPNVTSMVAAAGAISIAVGLVLVATYLERLTAASLHVPGTMCAHLALMGLGCNRLLQFLTTRSKRSGVVGVLRRIPGVSPALSNVCFYLLFSAVGTSANVGSAMRGGPSALAFASLALIIHSAFIILGCWGFLRLTTGLQKLRPGWQEVLIASNAAIGGPSTAAAFAVGLVPGEESLHQSALVIGATVWGVVGYAIGTSCGVTMARFLC
ncbi:hypothetical protein THAOC_35769 [Thalassiosira oceanica]|uniref:Uncharacterized protein n=1 Tax=Thalassiosira oceanica TaxID=159749 RepID=K0RGB7_THAOC|nr:hypothetical protein THAOC_35769 [Thalassiosira oceanica]|eukprot:EJK45607.1 hypothetical protein THAOC_35769 [Thalassiosira oceanica]